MFHQPANRRRGQQKIPDLVGRSTGNMILPIADGGRDHPGGAIGRRSHHLPTGGVFLIHRHRVHAHPVIDGVRRGQVLAALTLQCVVNGRRAASHFQTTGQGSAGVQTALDTGVHHFPQARQSGVQSVLVHMHQLVCALESSNRQPAGAAHLKHLHGVLERVGRGRAGVGTHARRQLGFGQNKAAADRIVGLLQDHLAAQRSDSVDLYRRRSNWHHNDCPNVAPFRRKRNTLCMIAG